MDDEKAALLQALNNARAQMEAVVEAIGTQREVYPTWTIKEILAHIAGWDDALVNSIRAHAEAQPPLIPADRGIDAYNAQSVETRKALSYEQIVAEWRLARAELKQVIEAIPAAKLPVDMVLPWGSLGKIEELVTIMANHEADHATEIRQLISDAAQQPSTQHNTGEALHRKHE